MVEFVTGLIVTVLTGVSSGAVIARIGLGILLSVVTSKLFGPKVPEGVGLSSLQVTTRSALEYRKIVYGQALVSGPIVYQNTAGANLEDLWTVIALCQDRSEEIVSIWLDEEEIPVMDIDWIPGVDAAAGSGTGDVTTARWVGEANETAVRAFWALGYSDQAQIAVLDTAFSDITTDFRCFGVTYMVLQFIRTPTTEKVWKDGVPRDFKALVKGRLLYDSRLDSTNGGSGSHRVDDETTWEWSDNGVLAVADYLVNVMGVDP